MFHTFIVLERAVERLDDALEPFALVVGDGFSDRLDLLPCNPGEVGDDVDDPFKRLFLNHHLLLVQVDPRSPFSIVSRSVAELRNPIVFGRLCNARR